MKYFIGLLAVLFLVSSAGASPYYVNNYQANNKVNVTLKRVEFDSRYFLGLDGYYSVGQTIHDKLQQDKYEQLRKEHEELKSLLQQIQNSLDNGNTGPVSPPNEPSPTPEQPTPDPVEPPVDDEPYIATELDKVVYGVFKTHCAQCHNESNKKGGVQLVNKGNGSLLYQPLETRVLIDWVTRGIELNKHDKKLMPLNGKPLSEPDSNAIYLWMQEEAARYRAENTEQE
jgi:hypothetical protein